jgi:hypothetical protein
LGALRDTLARAGHPLPDKFENLDTLTPFGAAYRYEDYDGIDPLNWVDTRSLLQSLRAWVEDRLRRNAPADPAAPVN